MVSSDPGRLQIWHQSFTDLSEMNVYRRTLAAHARRVVAPTTRVVLHGLRPGTYGAGVAPIDAIRYRYLEFMNEYQLCEAGLAAEREGFAAMAIGCFFDPALRELRSLVNIPVVSLAETCMLVACSLGRQFGLVTLCGPESANLVDLAVRYGLRQRLAAVVSMDPAIDEYALEVETEGAEDIEAAFARACRGALGAGAEVLIPGDGVLNEFLVRRKRTEIDGAPVMDAVGVLFTYAEMLARLRATTGLAVSRRQFYARPPDELVERFRRSGLFTPLAGVDFSACPVEETNG